MHITAERGAVPQFPGAAGTTYTNESSHTGHEFSCNSGARCSESGCGQGVDRAGSSRGCEGQPVVGLSWFLRVCWRPWCSPSLPSSLPGLLPVCLSLTKCPLFIRMPVVLDDGPLLQYDLSLITPTMAVYKSGHVLRSRGLGLQPILFERTQVRPSRPVITVTNLTVPLNFLSVTLLPHVDQKLGCPRSCAWNAERSKGVGQGGAPLLLMWGLGWLGMAPCFLIR